MMTIEIQLRSAREALRRVHVLGSDADLMAGSIRALDKAIAAIDQIKKEEKEREDQGQGE